MILDPSIAVQRAVVLALKSSAALQKLIGVPARVYDRVPPGASLPYVTIGEDEVRDNSAEDMDGAEVTAMVHVWSADSKAAAKAIAAAAVVAVAMELDLSPDGQRCTSALVESLHHLSGPDGETFHSVVSVTYQTEPAD